LESSIYDILRYSIDELHKKLDPKMDDYYFFADFEYSARLQKIEIYSDNTIKVFFCEDENYGGEIDYFIEPEKYAVLYYGAPPRAKGDAIWELLRKLFDKKVYFKILSIYKEDRAIFSLEQNKKTEVAFANARARAKKIGVSINKIGAQYDLEWKQDEKRQDFLIVDTSGNNFKTLNVFEEALNQVEYHLNDADETNSKVLIHPMDVYSNIEYDYDGNEYIDSDSNKFDDLLVLKKAPVSIFQKNKRLSNFEKHIKKLYDIILPIPYTGEVQISYNDPFTDEEYEQFDFDKTKEIKLIDSAKTIKDLLENVLKGEDEVCWVHFFRYLGAGKLLIYLSFEENDFIKDNYSLYNKLLEDSYTVKFLSNERIIFQKQETQFIIHAEWFEPMVITVRYGNIQNAKKLLTENQMRSEMVKFLAGLSDWNCIPAIFNEKNFILVADMYNDINEDVKIKGYVGADECAAKSLIFLSTQRKKLTYPLLKNRNSVNQLVSIINLNEKSIFGKAYYIRDAEKLKDALAQQPKGFDKYKFQLVSILPKANSSFPMERIGNIILWKYEQKNDLVTIEYSIQKTSKELIMKIPFTKLTKGKKRN
jgi:hypothetical protein